MHAGDKTALAQQVNPLLPEVDVSQLGAATCVSLPRERNCGLVVDLNHSRLREFETRLLNCVAEREDLIRKECEGIYFSLRTRRSNVLLLERWVCRYRRQLRDNPAGSASRVKPTEVTLELHTMGTQPQMAMYPSCERRLFPGSGFDPMSLSQ